jgi:hypothetical protein
MTRLKKILATGAIAALAGAGTVVASTSPASAYVVCNRWGNCWHVHRHYYYPAYYGNPYYNSPYYYGSSYGYDPYYYGPSYYGPSYGYYGGPTIGFGFTFGGGGHGHWHHH